MSEMIDRQDVIDLLQINREEEYKKSLSAECKHKSVIRSKHDAHVAFCDYLIECVKQLPTHPTPSNTLDTLDCVDRQAAIKAICERECDALKPCEAECESIWAVKELPSVHSKLEKNSKELENKNGELISRQAAIDVLVKGLSKIPYMNNTDEDMIRRDERIGCIQEVRTLPSVQPRKGKWINHLDDDGHHIADCSECGHAIQWFDDEDEPKYCCMCGSYNGDSNNTKPKSCFEGEYSVDYDDDTVMCSEVKGIISISQNHDMIPLFCPKYVEQI